MTLFDYKALEYSSFYADSRHTFSYHGYRCFIKMNTLGYLCGYVALPKNHPLEKCSYDVLYHLPVHGDITFAADIVDKPIESCWALGFDCCHSNDAPLTGHILKMTSMLGTTESEDLIYTILKKRMSGHVWKDDEVATECRRLVDGVEAMLSSATLISPLSGIVTPHTVNNRDIENIWVKEIVAGATQDRKFAEKLANSIDGFARLVPASCVLTAPSWVEDVLSPSDKVRLEATARIWESCGFNRFGAPICAGEHIPSEDVYETFSHWTDILGIQGMLDAYANDVPLDDVIA